MKTNHLLFYITDAEDEVLNKFCFVDKEQLPHLVLISPKEESVFKYENKKLQENPSSLTIEDFGEFISD